MIVLKYTTLRAVKERESEAGVGEGGRALYGGYREDENMKKEGRRKTVNTR